MKKTLLSFTLLLGFYTATFGQANLVPNPSFETYTNCPDFSGQLDYVTDWNNVNLVYGNFNYGTPDYYNTCSTNSLATLPNNSFATLNPFDGDGVVGLVIYNYDVPDYREYIATQLTQPLNQENSYTIKFRLTGGSIQHYRFNSHNFGIVFSESPLTQNTYNIINELPQIELDTLLNSNGWIEYSFTYTPDKAYNYITLGSFKHDADINAVDNAISSNKYSTVFIDAIEIKSANGTSIKNNKIENINVIYANENILISNPEKEKINTLIITDVQGREIYTEAINSKENTVINLPQGLNSGVYFATLFSDSGILSKKFIVSK